MVLPEIWSSLKEGAWEKDPGSRTRAASRAQVSSGGRQTGSTFWLWFRAGSDWEGGGEREKL